MSKYHIQVVDDDPSAVLLLKLLLEKNLDCRVSISDDGLTAVRMAKETQPDLILIDWLMPNLDGIEAIRHLKENILTDIIPIIMITCVTDRSVLYNAYEAGVSDFINKPIQKEELLAKVESALKMGDIHKVNLDAARKDILSQSLRNIYYDGFQSRLLNILKDYKQTNLTDENKAQALFKELIREMEAGAKDKAWNRLDSIVQETDPEFLRKLGEKHPNLTRTEIKLCYLLRINLNIKDISAILFKTPESVHIARIRLRKKLNLTREQNLSEYIQTV